MVVQDGFDFSYFKQGTKGNDKMIGGRSNDRLDGGAGIDTMSGGLGNDAFVVRNYGDKVIEKANEGTDTVYSFVTFNMSENIEKLFLVGTIWKTQAQDALGNSLNNYMVGNCGANHMKGLAGNDTIFGGGYGKDILEGNDGNDWIKASRRDCQLYGGNGSDSLVSWFGNDILAGGNGADLYKGLYKSTEIQEHGNFIGFGKDVIRDYMDYNKQLGSAPAGYDAIDLKSFSLSELTFKAYDSNSDGKLDRLRIDAGKYGTIDIDKYFNNTSGSLATSKAGIGYIEDIMLAGSKHIRLAEVQKLAKSTGETGDAIRTGNSGNNTLRSSSTSSRLYSGDGNDTLYSGFHNDLLCGGKGNDVYKGFVKSSDSQYMGWGHDVIRDYVNIGGTTTTAAGSNDKIDLSQFKLSDLSFRATDNDDSGRIDRLHIDAGKYGSIDIDNYFDDKSSSILSSHAGSGCIEDIVLAKGAHLLFADIQSILT